MYLGDSNSGLVFSDDDSDCPFDEATSHYYASSPVFGMRNNPIDDAVNDTYLRIDAERAVETEALRVLLNARRERQDKPWDATTGIAYCYTVRDDEDDSPLVEMVATTRVPRRAATATNGAWLYQLPSSGTFTVRGHGVVTVTSLYSTSTDSSTSVIIRGGLAVAYLHTWRVRYAATVNPLVGAWQNSIRVEWIDVDLSDHGRRAYRRIQRQRATKVRKAAFAAAVDTLLSGGWLPYVRGLNGGRVVYTTDPFYYHDAVSTYLSANAVLKACHLSVEDAATAIARATDTSYRMLSLPIPFDDNIVAPCCGVVKQLHKRAARLPARDRRNAVTEWYEEEAA